MFKNQLFEAIFVVVMIMMCITFIMMDPVIIFAGIGFVIGYEAVKHFKAKYM